MEFKDLRDAVRRLPFKPFAIRLAGGRSIPVEQPEFVAVGKRRAVVIQDDDSLLWLDPFLVVSLDWPAEKRNAAATARQRSRPVHKITSTSSLE